MGIFAENEPIEELPLEDVVYATGNEDVGYGMSIATQPSSFQTMKSLPQQVAEERVWFENEGDASQQHLWSDKASSSIFIPTPSRPHLSPPISPNSQIPRVVERAASCRTSPVQQELCWDKDICERCKMSLDEIFTSLGSVDSEKQDATGNCEDRDSTLRGGKLVGNTMADLCNLTNLPYFRRLSVVCTKILFTFVQFFVRGGPMVDVSSFEVCTSIKVFTPNNCAKNNCLFKCQYFCYQIPEMHTWKWISC